MTKEVFLRRQLRRKEKRDKITGSIFIIIIMIMLISAMVESYKVEKAWNDAHPTIRYGSIEY